MIAEAHCGRKTDIAIYKLCYIQQKLCIGSFKSHQVLHVI